VQEVVLKALNERIAVPGKVICMLHPWDAPVPLTRVWCLCRGWELHCAIKLAGRRGDYLFLERRAAGRRRSSTSGCRLKQRMQRHQAAGGLSTKEEGLVPTIDVRKRKAQATKEEDRVRIFTEIEDTAGIMRSNAQFQDFVEAAFQEEARTALITAAAGSTHDSRGRVILAAVHEERGSRGREWRNWRASRRRA
jgi:hypothetical protein